MPILIFAELGEALTGSLYDVELQKKGPQGAPPKRFYSLTLLSFISDDTKSKGLELLISGWPNVLLRSTKGTIPDLGNF